MDLQSLFRVLWKKRWILIIVPFFTVCCAFVIRMFGEWRYKSRAELATGLTVTDELIDKSRYFNPYEIQVSFTNLIEMMKSRAVIGLVSYKLLEHDLKGENRPFRSPNEERIKSRLKINIDQYKDEFVKILDDKIENASLLDPNVKEQKLLEKVIEQYEYDFESILEDLFVERISNSDFIEVSYLSEDPVLSAFVVNTLCQEFIRYYSLVKSNRSNVSLESLVAIVDQRKKHFDEKLEELKNFKSSNEMINSSVESENKIQQIKDYEDQINEEQQHIRGLELLLASQKVRIEQAEGSSGSYYNNMIVDLRKKINALNERYVQGGQSDHVLLDSISMLRDKLDQTIRLANDKPRVTPSELSDLKNKYEETRVNLEIARENLSSLNNILGSIRYNIGDFANKEAVSKAMEKEVDVAREEYLAAQARYNEAKAKLVTDKMSISQVLYGEAAEKPESRRTLVFMLFSGVLSFSICAFVIVMLELIDTSIKTPQALKRQTKFNLAGTIPQLPKNAGEPNWNFFLNENGNGQRLEMLNNDLRKIRFEIENRQAQVVLVTSTKKGQGKTFFVMALAYTLSLIKKRTLIIDTNLRNNSLTKMLVARTSLKQLIEYYNNQTKLLSDGEGREEQQTPPSDDKNLITHTHNDLVDIIGNKTSQLSPSEIIPEVDFKVLLGWLRNQYDYIILEGASLNEFSDSRELISFVDLVIPIFAADSSLSSEDRESLNYLRSLQDKLGPAVLNKVNKEELSS